MDKYQTEYKGPVGHEKKDHQTHFGVLEIHFKDSIPIEVDPDWERTGAGRWVYVGQKRARRGRSASEVA